MGFYDELIYVIRMSISIILCEINLYRVILDE